MLRQSHGAMDATQVLRVSQQGFERQAAQHQKMMEAIRQQQQAQEQQLQMQQLQRQHEEPKQQTRQPQGAPQTAGIERQSQQPQLYTRGFDDIETLWGGEDQRQNWSLKIKTAASELLNAAETGGVRNVEEILKYDESVHANRTNASIASKEMCSVLARYTNSAASTIVRSATDLGGEESWRKLHENHSGRLFRVQRECMYPKLVGCLSRLRLAILQWEEKWKAMMSELGGDVKSPDL